MATVPQSMNCYFRSLQMKYNNPLPRLNLTSPYPTNTKAELDMRRKAQVLKHQGPQKSNQINSLTKKQKFAQVVRGFNPVQKAISTKRYTLEQLSYCDSSNNKTISSSSDVPGKPILLYMDRSIPLYNYANEYRTYSNQPRPADEALPWRFFVNEQAKSSVTTGGIHEINIGTLQILKDIPSEIAIFSINIPGVYTPADISGKVELIVRYANQEIQYIDRNFTYVVISSNIYISNIQLYTVEGYFLEFFVKIKNANTSFRFNVDHINIIQQK